MSDPQARNIAMQTCETCGRPVLSGEGEMHWRDGEKYEGRDGRVYRRGYYACIHLSCLRKMAEVK